MAVMGTSSSGILRYAPVGCCIYCGRDGSANELGDEHIVPFALQGQAILPKSSCKECADITSAFEGRCAHAMYRSLRITQNIQTRRPKKRPKTLPMRSSTTGQIVEMPIQGVITTIPTVQFRPPGYFRNPLIKETNWTGATLGVQTGSPRNIQIWQDYSSPDFSVEQGFDLDSFARMMAKIAHATCVGTFGLDWLTPWLPPYILGADAALSYVVGGAEGPLEPKNTLHEIRYDVTMIGGILLVTCTIRLFAQFGGPHTKVIVGQTTEECVQSFNRKSANVAPLESVATQ
jgi:hypothetical protein